MKFMTMIALLLGISHPVIAQDPAKQDAAALVGWKLVWQDEFNGKAPDDKTWSRCKRETSDWNNTMSDDPRLVELKDGILRLHGIVNDRKDDKAPYLTAGLTSMGKYSFKYGKVQIRARFNSAQGAWPALWMMGEKGAWPANGEIDLMEHLNFDSMVYQTVHSEYTHKLNGKEPAKSATTKINRDDWNTYGCEWNEDKIVFTVNGKPSLTYPKVSEKGEKQWPFNQPFYFILSMQIGGGWVNASGASNPAHYPVVMEVDWIRVYERETGKNQ